MSSSSSSPPSPEMIRFGVLDPFRRLCESHQFHFVVFLQHASSSSHGQRFWTSSKELRNFFGHLLTESATFIDVLGDDVSFPGNGNDDDISRPVMRQEAADEAFAAADELKMDVVDGESLAAFVADAALTTATGTTDYSTTATETAAYGTTAASAKAMERHGDDAAFDDECVLLPTEELEDETDGREGEEEGGGEDVTKLARLAEAYLRRGGVGDGGGESDGDEEYGDREERNQPEATMSKSIQSTVIRYIHCIYLEVNRQRFYLVHGLHPFILISYSIIKMIH